MPLEYLTAAANYREKEQMYLAVRQREGRVLSDEALLQLPDVALPPDLAKEWRWRKRSLARLDTYLTQHYRQRAIRILDLGCGNGWMSNHLANNPQRDVWAVDLNETELEQGSRVFQKENLRFVYADVLQEVLPKQHFDAIVLAAAVQYFPDLKQIIAALRALLLPKGEIHIIDSPFYKNEDARVAAQQRSQAYYQEKGIPEMAEFYHHHLWGEAQALGAENLNVRPDIRVLQRLGMMAPFPWLRFF